MQLTRTYTSYVAPHRSSRTHSCTTSHLKIFNHPCFSGKAECLTDSPFPQAARNTTAQRQDGIARVQTAAQGAQRKKTDICNQCTLNNPMHALFTVIDELQSKGKMRERTDSVMLHSNERRWLRVLQDSHRSNHNNSDQDQNKAQPQADLGDRDLSRVGCRKEHSQYCVYGDGAHMDTTHEIYILVQSEMFGQPTGCNQSSAEFEHIGSFRNSRTNPIILSKEPTPCIL